MNDRTLKQSRARLDKLTGYQGSSDYLRMERASDVLVGKESYIKWQEAAIASLEMDLEEVRD